MIHALRVLLSGESYWQVIFTSGKKLSELDTKPTTIHRYQDLHAGDGRILPAFLLNRRGEVRMRRVEWLEDIIGSGDLRNVKEAILHTPRGEVHFTVSEPYTVFQFSRGTMAVDPDRGTVRIKNAQIVGVVTDKDTGDCEYAAWDVQSQQLYTGFNCVKNFKAWRTGIIDPGILNIKAMDIRLDI
jgi:hypothetical protein